MKDQERYNEGLFYFGDANAKTNRIEWKRRKTENEWVGNNSKCEKAICKRHICNDIQ